MPPDDAFLHSSQPIERWSLRMALAQPLAATDHSGSMLRGAFGHALKALACRCSDDSHLPGCIYQQIFEPRPPAGWPLRYSDCPPAFVVTPPPVADGKRTQMDFSFTLLGPALEHRALVWQAWQQAAGQGLGMFRTPARLQAVDHEAWPPLAPQRSGLVLRLISPLLLKRKHHGQQQSRPLRPDELCGSDLLIALHRRLELTRRLYGVPAQPLPSLDEWLAQESSLRLDARLAEQHFARRSNRQQQRMPLYGLSGDIHLSGSLPSSLRSALAIGQWLHIGGKTALGLGGYRLHSSLESSVDDRSSLA